MIRLRTLLFGLVFAWPPSATAQEPTVLEVAPATPVIDVEKLRREIQEILESDDIPGASVALVAADRTIWAGGVGKADVAADVEVTADHLFRIGSISKSFTALAVLRAVEDGLIDLTSPVRSLAPEIEFENRWEDTHPITVAMVMEHTTGFDDIHFREYAKIDDPEITLREGLAYNPASRVSRWRPGMHMSYCNSGPPIAAYILEKVSGRSFEDFVREQVFDVLGMETATFGFPADAALMAKGYADGVTEANYDHITVRPSGAMNASSREMARYLRTMINRGALDGVTLLTPETITRMETPTTTLAARAGFTDGYGLGNYASGVNGHLFHGHNGGITGFVSISAYSSELGVGYFVSINKMSGKVTEIADLLGERLTAAVDAPPGATVSLKEDELRAVAGFYQNVTPRMQLMYVITRFLGIRQVVLDGDELFVEPLIGGEKKKLIPVTASSFRLEDEPAATMFRVIDEEGSIIFQGLSGNSRKVSGLWAYGQLMAAIGALLLLISAVAFALVWIPLKAFGRLKGVHLRTVLFPLLAALSPFAFFVLPMATSSDVVQDLGTMTGASLAVYIGSLVFVALTAVSLYTSYLSYSLDMSRTARLHAVLVSLACLATLSYAWANGLIGLETWAS